ncbi:MAG: M6 family metalloprotease domain-containing protein [Candidatus Latescibacteria bacterium]|nr:M6 family metalloprotease domain-containing protein [Candidatus Latescibacterota bacterium]
MQWFLLAIFFSGAFPAAARGAEFLCAGVSAPLLQTGVRAKPAAAQGLLPEGQVRAAVIFATFAGEEAVLPSYAAEIFRPDLPGSLSHFYRAMSFGRLSLTGEVLPRVYMASKKAPAYMEIREEERAGDFALEIIQQVDREVDFGRYDSDGPDGVPNSGDDDGLVDCLFLNLLTMPSGFLRGPATGMASLRFDEYPTDDPAAGGGLIRIRGRRGTLQRVTGFSYAVGSMAHEFGHLLGLPDLYDIEGDTPAEESAGVGAWCLMGRGALGWSGEEGPNPFCAWCREQLGWVGGIVEVLEPLTEVAMGDVETGGAVYRVPVSWRGGRPEEYLLLENRQRSNGFYDRRIPGEGLLIWHVVKGGDNDAEERKLLDLECADGRFADRGWPDGQVPDPERGGDNLDFWSRDEAYRLAHGGNEGDATDPFDGERFTSFSPDTNPKSSGSTAEIREAVIGPTVTRIRRQGNGVMLADIAPPQWAGQIHSSGREGSEVVWRGTVDLAGDLVIGEGVALAIAPGTVVRVAAGDLLQSGEDPERVEIVVRGVLRSFGTPSTPVVFTGPDWHGIRWEQGNSYYFFNRAANRLEGARVGLALGRTPLPTEGIHFVLSSPETLAPGENASFQVGLWNAAAEPVKIRVKGVIEDPFVRNLSAADYTAVISPGGVDRNMRFPLTIASEAPEGREIALVAKVTTGTGETVEDTLRATIVGRDTTPPDISYGQRRSLKVRVGTPFTMRFTAWEPGPLEALTAYILEEEAVVDSLPLFRRGAENDQPNTSLLSPARDFMVKWVPPREMDFQVWVAAIDAAGNVWRGSVTESVAARPYQRIADLLLWGPRARLVSYENLFGAAGLTSDTWAIEEGPISAAVLDLYRAQAPGVVVWLGPSTLEEGIQQLNAFLRAGGRLLVATGRLGGVSRNFPQLRAFFRDFARAALSASLVQEGQMRGSPGDPISGGLVFEIPSYDEYVLASGSRAILADEGGMATGLRTDGGTYRLVLFGFDQQFPPVGFPFGYSVLMRGSRETRHRNPGPSS